MQCFCCCPSSLLRFLAPFESLVHPPLSAGAAYSLTNAFYFLPKPTALTACSYRLYCLELLPGPLNGGSHWLEATAVLEGQAARDLLRVCMPSQQLEPHVFGLGLGWFTA